MYYYRYITWTLITLVITVIVLLILAGVTIAALNGDNGILIRAKEAKEKTEQAQKQELLSDLNKNGNNSWKNDDKNINNGYPILNWME